MTTMYSATTEEESSGDIDMTTMYSATTEEVSSGDIKMTTMHRPVLEGRYYGPIEGRVIAIDRSASDAVRLTLDQVDLDLRPGRITPTKVRVSLHGTPGDTVPVPGMVIGVTGHLSPPGGPVEPDGFDFRRHA